MSEMPMADDAVPESDWLPGDPWRTFLESRVKGSDYFPSLTRFIREHHITSVVEIGVRTGYSLAAMLRGNPQLTYLGIDDGRERPDGLAHAQHLADGYPEAEVTFWCVDSQTVETLPGRIDLAYIDGDHSEAACWHDLHLCARYCDRLLCDDYDYSEGVRRAVQRFCREQRYPLTYLATVHGWALIDTRVRVPAMEVLSRMQGHAREGRGMAYYYDGGVPTIHRRLGLIQPGRNDFNLDDPRVREAVEALVASGTLRALEAQQPPRPKPTPAPAKAAEEAPAADESPYVAEDEDSDPDEPEPPHVYVKPT